MNNTYYQHEIRRLTYSELYRMCANFMEVAVSYAFKTLQIPVTIPSAVRYPDQLIIVAERALPSHIRDRTLRDLGELRASRLENEFFYKLQTIGPQEIFGWTALLEDKATVAVYCITRFDEQTKIDEKIEFELQSVTNDDQYLISSNKKNLLDCPEEFDYQWEQEIAFSDVSHFHQSRIASCGSPVRKMEAGAHESQMLRILQVRMDSLIDRGVFKPLAEKKVKKMRG